MLTRQAPTPQNETLQIANTSKAQYAAFLLYIISVCLAKMSVVAMIWYITPNQRDRRILWGTGGIIIAWAFIAFWVSAFECHSPHVWNLYNGRCINRVST